MPPSSMNRPVPLDKPSWKGEQSGLLTVIVLLHIGALWALTAGPSTAASSPQPTKVVSAFMVQAAAPEVIAPPMPEPAAPLLPPKPAVVKPPSKPKPKLKPKPEPKRAISTPVEEPSPEPMPSPASTPAAATSAPAPSLPTEGPVIAQAPAASAPSVPQQPKTITSGVEYVHMPPPKYPRLSRRLGEEGKVMLRVLINEKGKAERIDIQQSSGSARLDQAAQEAVQQARFKPYFENGRAIAVFAIVPIAFQLEN